MVGMDSIEQLGQHLPRELREAIKTDCMVKERCTSFLLLFMKHESYNKFKFQCS